MVPGTATVLGTMCRLKQPGKCNYGRNTAGMAATATGEGDVSQSRETLRLSALRLQPADRPLPATTTLCFSACLPAAFSERNKVHWTSVCVVLLCPLWQLLKLLAQVRLS